MESENFEFKKIKYFKELMYSFDWIDSLETQLANHFFNFEAVSYIEYIIKQLTPKYQQAFLENIYNDHSIFDEIIAEDYKDGNSLADLNAHIRYYNQIEKELPNLIPKLRLKKEEKRIELLLLEKSKRVKVATKKYGYTGLKLMANNNYNDVISEFWKNSKEYGLISKSTTHADFSRIFRGVDDEIFIDNRVVWLKSVPALRWFVTELMLQQLIEPLPTIGKWNIVCNCFCNIDNKPYTNDSFRNNHDPILSEVMKNMKDVIRSLKEDVKNN